MSLPEVAARASDTLHSVAQRYGFLLATRPPSPKIHSIEPWIAGCGGFRRANYENAALEILAGTQPVFSTTNEIGADGPQWNRDPLTGTIAPCEFGKFIDLRSESVVGNIKYLWEPNRHLELVTIAQAYEITKDQRFLEAIETRLKSWFDQCPYMMGPNWTSGLELAIRLINWSLTWQLIGAERSPLFDGKTGEQFRDTWLRIIYQHAHFIQGNYSRFSSANNHLIGEAAGVFIARCSWPYWQDLEQWGSDSRRILIEEALKQTYDDGVNCEQAISYQQFVLDFLILSGISGRARGIEFPTEFWQAIERMIEFLHSVMDVNGNMPMIGDADDGLVVRVSQHSDFCPYRSLLASGAILFNRQDFAAKSGGLDDKSRFLFGDDTWTGVSPELGGEVNVVRRRFPDGGYYILGHGLDTEREVRMLIDAGPLGFLSIAAHGHADALAIYLSVAGREFLVDPGTYTYDGKPQWRAYFRGTRAHNTLTVDGLDQSVQGGNFMWTRHSSAECIEFTAGVSSDTFVGQHDGYTRISDPVVHERSILRHGVKFEIVDTLKCGGSHLSERYWHFSEQCQVNVSGDSVYAENGGARICLSANDPETEIVCLRASDQPIGGWISRRFDAKSASTSVIFVDRVQGTTSLSASIQCLLE